MAGHRNIALDATAFVQDKRVNHLDRCHRHVVRAGALQEGFRIAAFDLSLAHRGVIDDPDGFPCGPLFIEDVGQLLRPAETQFGYGFLAFGRIPGGPFPAERFAEIGPSGREHMVERRVANAARRLTLKLRVVQRIGQGQRLGARF